MWQKENINELAENSLQDEYIKIIKSAQKEKDSNQEVDKVKKDNQLNADVHDETLQVD